MNVLFEFEALDEFLDDKDKTDLLKRLERSSITYGIEVEEVTTKLTQGSMASLDPAFWGILVNFANVGAVGIAVKGIFDSILQWQKNRSQKITIKMGEVSLEIPVNASKKEILELSKELVEMAQSLKGGPGGRVESGR
jgi:hypothetical protein